jgi:hypothetical protein
MLRDSICPVEQSWNWCKMGLVDYSKMLFEEISLLLGFLGKKLIFSYFSQNFRIGGSIRNMLYKKKSISLVFQVTAHSNLNLSIWVGKQFNILSRTLNVLDIRKDKWIQHSQIHIHAIHRIKFLYFLE